MVVVQHFIALIIIFSKNTLKRSNYPKILFEMNENDEKLIKFLEELNYNIVTINNYNNMFLAVNRLHDKK